MLVLIFIELSVFRRLNRPIQQSVLVGFVCCTFFDTCRQASLLCNLRRPDPIRTLELSIETEPWRTRRAQNHLV